MSTWVRNLTMIVCLTVWAAVIAAYLHAGELPDAALIGVPAALILALSPPLVGRRRPPNNEEPP